MAKDSESLLRIHAVSQTLSNRQMPTIDEIRRSNLATLITEFGGNKTFSERLGVSESQLSQWAKGAANSATGKPRGMRTDTAQRIEAAGGKPPGWLDQPHERGEHPSSPVVPHPQAGPTLEQAPASRPPVITEDEWKSLSPRARALVEDTARQAQAGRLTDQQVKVLHDLLEQIANPKT